MNALVQGKNKTFDTAGSVKKEFITVEMSDEKEPSVAEITKPFFTSLVME